MMAAIAQQQFERRRTIVMIMRRQRSISEERAVAMLQPWASMVLRCGGIPRGAEADLADLSDVFAPAAARAIVADDYCRKADLVTELEQACQRSWARMMDGTADHAEAAHFHNLQVLAMHFGARASAAFKRQYGTERRAA